jgi:hypothetical protein
LDLLKNSLSGSIPPCFNHVDFGKIGENGPAFGAEELYDGLLMLVY